MRWKDRLKGGQADCLRPQDFPKRALLTGMRHELEHTKSHRLAMEIAMDHLAEDPKYYEKLAKMERQHNPSVSRRQQRFMCAEYGRATRGQRTRTSMKRATLKEFCMARRKKNPHLTSGKWRFIGIFEKRDIPSVRRILKIHGMKNKVTRDHLKREPGMRELYVERGGYDTAYRAITRLFEGGRAA